MSRRIRMVLIGLAVLVVGGEVLVRLMMPARTSVRIINSGTSPIENLVVVFGGSRVGVGTLPAEASTLVWLSGSKKGTLALEFTQAGNPMSGFQITDFDPRSLHRDGLKQVLDIMSNQVMKYVDDEEYPSPLGRLGGRIGDWISAELGLAR